VVIGGVVAGKSIKRSSEVSSVVKDFQKFKSAALLFKQQYRYYPGDMPNAQDYWPSCVDQGIRNPCNGNGNGAIEGGVPTGREDRRSWQHLSLAEILPEKYDGDSNWVLGVSYPPSKIKNAGYEIFNAGSLAHLCNPGDMLKHCNPLRGTIGNHMRFGKKHSCSINLGGYVLTPAEAKSIDNKLDDGNPVKGRLKGIRGQCTVELTDWDCESNSAEYKLSNKEPACILYFFID